MLRQLRRYDDWAAGSTTSDTVFDSREERVIFLFCKVFRQAEGSTQVWFNIYHGFLSLGVKAAVT
jgi:hypothetical protein